MLHCTEESVIASYESARAALRSFQPFGAVFLGHLVYRSLEPDQTRRLLTCYNRLADGQGRVPVTYRFQYLIAEKSR